MPTAYFPSLEQADTLDIVFSKPNGGEVPLRLLVDSGFTGRSCFVLPENAVDLEHAPAADVQVLGALHGSQKRSVVADGIPALSFQFEALAILTDISSLALPAAVQGIVGLRFLRQFHRWGAERMDDGLLAFLPGNRFQLKALRSKWMRSLAAESSCRYSHVRLFLACIHPVHRSCGNAPPLMKSCW
jgi:hypothetical protein